MVEAYQMLLEKRQSRQDHVQPHCERVERLVRLCNHLPHTPRSLHWFKWRWRDQQPLRTGALTSDEAPGSRGWPLVSLTSHGSKKAEGILKP